MEGNREVNMSQSPSLQVVLVKGRFAPSWGGAPTGGKSRCCRMDWGEGLCWPPCSHQAFGIWH